MKFWIEYFKIIFILIDAKRFSLYQILFLFFLFGIMDIAGIGAISALISSLFVDDGFKKFIEYFAFFHIIGLKINSPIDIFFLFFLFYFLRAVLQTYIIYKTNLFAGNELISIRDKLLKSVFERSTIDQKEKTSSEFIYAFETLSVSFAFRVLFYFFKTTGDIILSSIVMLTFVLTNPIFFIIIIFFSIIFVFIYNIIFKKIILSLGILNNSLSERLINMVSEVNKGLVEIKIYQKSEFFFNRIYLLVSEFVRVTIKKSVIDALPKIVLEFLIVLFLISIFISKEISGTLTEDFIFSFSLFSLCLIRLNPVLTSIMLSVNQLRFRQPAIKILYELITDIEEKKDDYFNYIIPDKLKITDDKTNVFLKHLKLKEVDFGYVSGKDVFKNLNFEIFGGQKIAVIGGSGSGKSTFLNILMGIYQIKKGSINFNGKLLNQDDFKNLWKLFCYIPQEPFFLNESIKFNISLKNNLSKEEEEKLINILKILSLNKFISELDESFNTILNENAFNISGGQKQRIAIARALFFDREILVFDESTSALDYSLEEEIINSIFLHYPNKTMIISTHRLEVLKRCDIVYKISNNKILEEKY